VSGVVRGWRPVSRGGPVRGRHRGRRAVDRAPTGLRRIGIERGQLRKHGVRQVMRREAALIQRAQARARVQSSCCEARAQVRRRAPIPKTVKHHGRNCRLTISACHNHNTAFSHSNSAAAHNEVVACLQRFGYWRLLL